MQQNIYGEERMHDDVYLWNNRIITQKEIDKYLNRISREDKIDSLKKVIAIIIVSSFVITLGTCAYICINKKNQKDEVLKPAKIEKYQNMNIAINTVVHNEVSARGM